MSNTNPMASNSENAADYDTGVSNGDVEWLFRGKSKKLTKKMNSTNERRMSAGGGGIGSAGQKERSHSHSQHSNNSSHSTSVPSSKEQNDLISNETKIKKMSGTEADKEDISTNVGGRSRSASDSLNEHDPISKKPLNTSGISSDASGQQDRISKLEKFRLGRTRSSSTSSMTNQSVSDHNSSVSPGTQRRKSSFSFIPSPSNPQNNLNEITPDVARSNSFSKRSIFTSLSSKFKSSNVTPGSSNTSTPSTSANASPVVSSQTSKSSLEGQDIPPLTNGIPINSKRRNSITSKLSISPKESGDRFFRRGSASSSSQERQVKENDRIILNKNPNKETIPNKHLNNIELKRVMFAIDRLSHDPQQQIPSRNPRRGNVLMPDEILSPAPRLCQGISINDGNGNKTTQGSEVKYSEKELQQAISIQNKALLEAEKHAFEAHLSAKRIAHEIGHYKLRSSLSKSVDEEEENEEVDHDLENIEIDKPLHVHENHFEESEKSFDEQQDISLETLYTRCCHLREILPIPATLKQLKNKTKPLQVLKLLNPKPTLVDALSFSDFIGITPINTVIFDNVFMTTEMLKHFLASLMGNKSLEKLSLRNVPIDNIGWGYLCKFLSRNQNVKKLDISQQRIKSDTKPSSIRSEMNWDLFIQALVIRGGIEELVINGCKLTDSIFKELVHSAVKLNTFRFGIASIELNLFKAKVIADWMADPDSKCLGVDIAFNDLTNGQLAPLIDAFNKGTSKLIFFSLNSTYLSNIEEAAELIKSLINIKTLRFLDLSSLPDLFPGIISKLSTYLPQFPSLKRIHFDLNDLSSQSINAIAEILPKIQGLGHVSFLGNRNLNNSSAGILYTAVKSSGSIFSLDLDYELVSDTLSQRIAFYLMRNMDKTVNSQFGSNVDNNEEELMFDGSLLMESAEKLLIQNDEHKEKKDDAKIQKIILNALIERTRAVRKDVHNTIDTLFEKRKQGTLSLEGKENLLRFVLLDSSLEKVANMFEEQAEKNSTPIEDDPGTRDLSLSSHESVSDKNIKKLSKSIGNIDLSKAHDNLHQNSKELITSGPILSPHSENNFDQTYFQGLESTFQPHQVVTESSSDGKNVPIDKLTGRPVLMKSISHTSLHAKEQEQEEGEFHRWGFFIQQRSNNGTTNKSEDVDAKVPREKPTLNVLPSGSELRDAIIAAKGIESVTELIDKINDNRVSIEKIYTVPEAGKSLDLPIHSMERQVMKPQEISQKKDISSTSPSGPSKPIMPPLEEMDDDNHSINSESENVDEGNWLFKDDVNAVVDEAYDKLLNDAQRVRSNK